MNEAEVLKVTEVVKITERNAMVHDASALAWLDRGKLWRLWRSEAVGFVSGQSLAPLRQIPLVNETALPGLPVKLYA